MIFLTWLFTGEEEPEFEAILDTVDPNRTESISLQDYMAYMITKETENVATSDEIVNAFQAITPKRGSTSPKRSSMHTWPRKWQTTACTR